ncbi:DNA polymerase III subunit chi [Francisella frigiditurris]|uniref:DNA polymerase III chi subunit, HolC family protein n=1 Tax=Francisella frigiditurris TaxID=1542390 RepID=A0A1J0KVC7_9GAMM|nr:DNA polymerase III subunit chi [Francisella frigiditurris]APC97639.1 DNA polymerase III chi subunit, HolC family protein [Francisella frigiditurris]
MKVSFRILNSNIDEELMNYITDFVVKGYSPEKRVAILADKTLAKHIDEKLWKDGEDIFIPHFCAINSTEYDKYPNVPVFITDNMFLVLDHDLLINITNLPVNIAKKAPKEIIEIVDQKENRLAVSRKKYVYYKQLGIQPKHEKG